MPRLPELKPKIKNYRLEFKLRAVQPSAQPGVLMKGVANSPGIHPFMLSKWTSPTTALSPSAETQELSSHVRHASGLAWVP